MDTSTTLKVSKGTKFHASYADGNPEWEVTRSRGRGVWEAKVVNDADWGGVTKVFKTEEITHSVRLSQFFADNTNTHAKFYAGLKLGAVIHYHDSFDRFIRCEVVEGTTQDNPSLHHVLRPIALVGAWPSHDLPRRLADGSIYQSYHVEQIATGKCFEPNYLNLYESGSVPATRSGDPRKLPALDLSVPPLTSEAEATAKLWQAVKAARNALESGSNSDPKKLLADALSIIQGAL